jgi:Fur family ferric uptake transcriptional regulator
MSLVRRSTPIKKKILELLSQEHLLSASALLAKLHGQGILANKTSVYRNLESFLADGVICQQAFGKEFVYELQQDHHDHFHCSRCGKIEEISCQLDQVQVPSGHQVEHHHLTLYGICKDCQKARASYVEKS